MPSTADDEWATPWIDKRFHKECIKINAYNKEMYTVSTITPYVCYLQRCIRLSITTVQTYRVGSNNKHQIKSGKSILGDI